MKVISINNANASTFKGLWEKDYTRVERVDNDCIYKNIERIYHPFSDESASSIENALASKKVNSMLPSDNPYSHEKIVSNPKAAKSLSFTKEEFMAYKNFLGKKLPKAFETIEAELVQKNLGEYINGGFLYSIRKFLHNIIRR